MTALSVRAGTKPPAKLPPADQEWLDAIREAQRTRADLAVTVGIDGTALVDSASVEDAAHEVTVREGRAVRCSCWRFKRGRPCAHRAYVAIRLWEDAMGADLSQVEPLALRPTLISAYLTPKKQPITRWWLSSADGPEERIA
jgi:hypothetical protein